MPTMTTEETLADLLQKYQEKHDAAVRLSEKEGATADDVKAANDLFDERDNFAQLIKDAEATLMAASMLKGRAAKGQEWLQEAVRTVPFPKGDGKGQGGNEKKFRLESGESEAEKKARTGGFKSLGHFAYALARRGRDGLSGDREAVESFKSFAELQYKLPTGLFEESDPDGGVFVPPAFSTDIYRRMVDTNDLLRYLNPQRVAGNVAEYPVLLENSRVDGSRGGGMRSYWIGEADQYTPSKPQFSKRSLKLHKLTVMTYITEELLADSAIAIDNLVSQLAVDEINFKINDAIIRGTGNGMPLGILNSGSKITVTAVSGQGANTFVYQNVLDMRSRVVPGQRKSLIWLYNADAESQFFKLYMPTGSSAGVNVFTPNTVPGFSLFGRPALVLEQAESLGTAGDVIAFATDGYASIVKGGVENDMSMHLRFDYDERAYKWRFRFDGAPKDDVPLTPYKGSNTFSSIVVLNSTRT